MWYLLLILPTLLFADVEPTDVPEQPAAITVTPAVDAAPAAAPVAAPTAEVKTPAPAAEQISVPAKEASAAPAPVAATSNVTPEPVAVSISTAAPITASSAVTSPGAADQVTLSLRLKPTMQSPVVLELPEKEVSATAQDTGIVADGQKWYSIEREVMLTGYVDKASIEKDLDIAKGATVWTTPEKTAQLTVIDNPAYARLLEADRMGKVEVKEPRVLYYSTVNQAPETEASAPTTSPTQVAQEELSTGRRGSAVDSPNKTLMTLEGQLRKGNPLFGRKLYLEDANGQRICKIDKNSPIDWLTFEQYVDRTAVFVGELHETNGGLVLTVRAIRLR